MADREQEKIDRAYFRDKIADLRTKLQEAEEGLDRETRNKAAVVEAAKEIEAERNEAIERAERLNGQLQRVQNERAVQWERAETAEEYARQQEASAETARNRAECYWWKYREAKEQAENANRRMDGWAIAMRQANQITVGLRHDVMAAEALLKEVVAFSDTWGATNKGTLRAIRRHLKLSAEAPAPRGEGDASTEAS